MNNNFLKKADMLSKKDILKIVSGANYRKGYEYSDQKAVVSWNLLTVKGESTLTAKVLGSKVYTVKVYYLGMNLIFTGECSCPAYNRSNTCKHIACVIITLTRVITDPSYDKTLHESLFNPGVIYTNKVGLEISAVADRGARSYSMKYLIDPKKVDAGIKKFYSSIFDKISDAETNESRTKYTSILVKRALKDGILVVNTTQGIYKPKSYDEKSIITKQISFTPVGSNGVINILPIAKFQNGTKLSEFIDIESQKILDLQTGTIYNTDPQRIDFLEYFAQKGYVLVSDSDKVPLIYKGVNFKTLSESDYFLKSFFSYGSQVRDMVQKDVIMKSKDDSPINQAFLKYSLHIVTDYCLGFAVIGEVGSSKLQLSYLFNYFIDEFNEILDENSQFSTDYIRAQAFQLIATLGEKSQKELSSKVVNAEIKKIVQNIKLKYSLNSYSTSLVKKLFEELKKFILDQFTQSSYVYFLTKDNQIEYAIVKMKEIVVAFCEIYNFVQEDSVILGYDEDYIFQIVEQRLEKHLSGILSIAKKWDIPVFFDKKTVKFSKTSVFIDANRSSDLDWFEVNPEIKVDDKLMAESDWLKMLDAGKRETLSTIELLDENSVKILNIIKKLTNSKINSENKNSKDSKDTIVQNKSLKIFELLELKNKGVNLKLSKKDQEILDSLGRFKKLKTEIIPAKLNTDLRDYQSEGFSWLVFLYKHKFGACLADDMGLGKTVQAIAFLAYVSENFKTKQKLPHLIVVPPSLVFNWESELQRFYPKLKVSSYFGPKRKNIPMDSDTIITTYDTVRVDTKKFQKERFHIIIFDEAQAIKNIVSKRTAAARSLVGKFILCLTGTPLENSITEFYSIMDLALPGLFPEYKEFKSWNKQEMVDFITERSKPFLLRRKKETVLNELPEKTENDFYLKMSDSQKIIYQKIASEIKDKVSGAYKTKTEAQAAIIVLTALLRLRQICVSPNLVLSSRQSTKQASKKDQSPKLDYLADKLIELKQEGSAALVFSQFTKCLDLIELKLKKDKINYLRIDGSVPVKSRKAIIEKFQNKSSDVQVLLLSLKTGGVGLNLTRANHVFHVDPWWNPAVENQASDRVYRLGQKNHVTVTRILMKHSIEEKMMKLKKDKSELFRAIVEGAQAKVGKVLSKKDFDFLLS